MLGDETHLSPLKNILAKSEVVLEYKNQYLTFSKEEKRVTYFVSRNAPPLKEDFPSLNWDSLSLYPEIISGMILSKLKLNETIFARKCSIKQVDKQQKNEFLSKHHLMGATKSAYNYGLYANDEMVALATFSKGRKLNRLPEHLRSYELIRFCSKYGTTVTGGLSRLVMHFCKIKNAGDIMTYIDMQYGDERSFVSAGFKKADENDPGYYEERNQAVKNKPAGSALHSSDNRYLNLPNHNIKVFYTPGKL